MVIQSDIANYLYDYVSNYLYRDILSLGLVRKPKKVLDLLSLLALRIGGEVSINELSSALSVNRQTVENYLEVLEKSFPLNPLPFCPLAKKNAAAIYGSNLFTPR